MQVFEKENYSWISKLVEEKIPLLKQNEDFSKKYKELTEKDLGTVSCCPLGVHRILPMLTKQKFVKVLKKFKKYDIYKEIK